MNGVVPGQRHLDIVIGGIGVRLRSVSDAFVAMMAERFAGFIQTGAQAPHVLDVTLLPPPAITDEAEVEDDGESLEHGVEVTRASSGWRLTRSDFHVEWDPAARSGRIELVPSPYSLDSILRILLTVALAGEGGMLLHASSVVLNGRAYVFTGVSGAGKTTISRLAPEGAHLLTDEMSFIRQEGGEYFAHGTPFAGELAIPGENTGAPLAGIFLLAQGPGNLIEPLSPGEAVRTLMSNILYFAKDGALTSQVFDNAISLASRVPVRRLTFYPDASVWDLFGKDA